MSGLIVAAVFATLVVKAPVGFASGGMLFSSCVDSRQVVIGYATGWLDKWNRDEFLARRSIADAVPVPGAMVRSANLAASIGVDLCVPLDISPDVVGGLLCDFLAQNPQAREAAGDDLMMTVMRGKFSCRER